MRKIEDLKKEEIDEIISIVLNFLSAIGLTETRAYIQSLTNREEKLNWLIKYKNFYRDHALNRDQLKIIARFMKSVYSITDLTAFIQGKTGLTNTEDIQKAFDSWKPVFGSIEDHLNILEGLSPVAYKKEIKMESILVHPIPKDFIDDLEEEYLEEKERLIKVHLESFNEYQEISKLIPDDIEVKKNPGSKSTHPVRKRAVELYAKDKADELDQIDSKVEKYKAIKKAFKGSLDHIHQNTIKDWI